MLQHGSLLLARSCRTPELLGVCDVADESAGNHDWSDRLLARIPSALGLRRLDASKFRPRLERGPWNCNTTRYENPAWTGLR